VATYVIANLDLAEQGRLFGPLEPHLHASWPLPDIEPVQ
jgi:hypothetical protein